jgi:uncharacterized membrane protein
MRDQRQTLFKTFTFALLHFGVAFSVTYALTGSVAIATGVGLIEPLVNTVAFYFHEHAWRRAEARRQRRTSAAVDGCGIVPAR